MTTQDPATPTPTDAPADVATPSTEAARTAIRKARGALARYRVLAIITGVMLLILCVEMLVKYGVGQFVDVDGIMRYVSWIPFAHGWIYVVYLVTVLEAAGRRRGSAVTSLCLLLGTVYFAVLVFEPARDFFALSAPTLARMSIAAMSGRRAAL